MKYFVVVLVLVLSMLFSSESNSCSCVGSISPMQGFHNSKAVFSARVAKYQQAANGNNTVVRLKVDRVWKGDIAETLEIDLRKSGCQYWAFKESVDYLIYTYAFKDQKQDEQHQVSMCSRTKLLVKGQIETQYLDAIVSGQDTKSITRSLPSILADDKTPVNQQMEAAKLISESVYSNPEILTQETLDAFIKASKSEFDEIKILVANFFSNRFYGRESVKEVLLDLLKDESYQVRNSAVSAINRAVEYEQSIFEALHQNLNDTREAHWDERLERIRTVTHLSVSLSKYAVTDYEKGITAQLLQDLIGKINDPYQKVSVIQQLGFLQHYATKAIAELREVLSASDHEHVKKYTMSALADLNATVALSEINSYLNDKNCGVSKHSILASRKIDPDGFNRYFKDKVMIEIKSRFDQCQLEYIMLIQELGEQMKPLIPFLKEKHKQIKTETWYKKQLGEILTKY